MANLQPVRLAFNTFEPATSVDPTLPPILFLHGIASTKEHWREIPQIVANATRRKTYALDARNHGDSEWSDDFNFDINTEDVIHFLDANDISRAILVGHSIGGITAIKVALKLPERIEKVIVEDMVVRKPPKPVLDAIGMCVSNVRKALEIMPDDLDEDDAKTFILQYYGQNIPEMGKNAKHDCKDGRKKDIIQLRKDENGRFVSKNNLEVIERALMDYESLSSEPSGVYEGPALFICAQLSPFLVASDDHHIKQFFPNAVFETIEDSTHDVHGDKPLEFTDALLKFIS